MTQRTERIDELLRQEICAALERDVTDGRIVRSGGVRVWRGGKVIHTYKIESLRRMKDDVREVATTFECGITLVGTNDLVEGDIIECFTQQMVSRAAR